MKKLHFEYQKPFEVKATGKIIYLKALLTIRGIYYVQDFDDNRYPLSDLKPLYSDPNGPWLDDFILRE